MLPRWFRVVLAAEIAGLATFAVVGLHVVSQGVHTAGDALHWLQPGRPPAASSSSPGGGYPSLLRATPAASPHFLYGAALLNPSLLVRLNRDTGATAVGEYTLLLNLEALARDEVGHLLGSILPAHAAAAGN